MSKASREEGSGRGREGRGKGGKRWRGEEERGGGGGGEVDRQTRHTFLAFSITVVSTAVQLEAHIQLLSRP